MKRGKLDLEVTIKYVNLVSPSVCVTRLKRLVILCNVWYAVLAVQRGSE